MSDLVELDGEYFRDFGEEYDGGDDELFEEEEEEEAGVFRGRATATVAKRRASQNL